MLHVLIGSNDDYDAIRAAPEQEPASAWVVPKSAHVGDPAVLFVRGRGVVGTAAIASSPTPGISFCPDLRVPCFHRRSLSKGKPVAARQSDMSVALEHEKPASSITVPIVSFVILALASATGQPSKASFKCTTSNLWR